MGSEQPINQETQEILRQVELGLKSDLSNLDLHGADLSNMDLYDVGLVETNLQGANLRGTNLRHTILSRSNMIGTDVLYVPAIGSSRDDNIYASPLYTDGKQTGWGFHLGCYYSESYEDTRARIVDKHGDGIYAKCFDLLYELCLMVFNPNEEK